MILEYWDKGRIKHFPQSAPALPDGFEKECARTTPGEWRNTTGKKKLKGMDRKHAGKAAGQQASCPELPKTAAAF